MKIILASVGTRGDMDPFVAIGEILTEKGHEVICAFPEQFRELVRDSGLSFASLGTRFIDLLDSDAGKAAMGGASGFKKIAGTAKLAMNQAEANKELLFNQQKIIESEKPDRILYNGKAIYPLIWGLKNKGKTIFVSPLPYMHYAKGHTHIAFNDDYGDFFNKLTFSLAHFGMIVTVKTCRKWLHMEEKIDRRDIRDMLRKNTSIYTISPSLFSKPEDWDENLEVLGYHESRTMAAWQPDKALTDFISKHKKILFITFGSMINSAPARKTEIILDILERNKIPAIINTASGGLVKPERFDSERIHFVSQIPYDWIFPKVYGVIHHGGSGTTHLAIKHGCATMIVPHIIDQFVWNTIIFEKGLGPKGSKIQKINTKDLEAKILDLLNNQAYKVRSEEISDQMKKENFKEELYDWIVS